jgi:hypothetical protein
MDFLASLPTWAIMGIVGAFAGLIGGLIAWSLQGRFKDGSRMPQLITFAAIGLGVALGTTVIVPAIADSAAAQCREAEAGAAQVNRDMAGDRIDDVTTIGQLTVDCDTKTIVYAMNVSINAAGVTEAGMEAVRQNFNSVQCTNTMWRDYLDGGWTISSVYTFSDGTTRTVVADCSPPAITPPATTIPAPVVK